MRRTSSTCSSGEVPDAERVRGARDLSQHRRRSRPQRLDVHRARDHVDRLGSRLGGRRRDRRAERPAARRRAGTGARHGVRDRRRVARRGGVCGGRSRAGERLMGFGHRVYKVRDPRADVLAAAAERMFTRAGDMSLYTLARVGRGDGAAPARGVQAGPPAADQRRVLHRAAPARPRPRRAALHADVRDQPRERLDCPRDRAATRQPHHSSAVGIRSARATDGGSLAGRAPHPRKESRMFRNTQ